MHEIGITVKTGCGEIHLAVDRRITAGELAEALGREMYPCRKESDMRKFFFISFYPMAFLQGERRLEECGIRDGSLLILKGTENERTNQA